ncbi:MAG: hypothetical protein JXB49_24695 [Bacteroidales bacterium]|nr:hypothetical protein [Bacteroidales bacterium]
MKKFLKSALAAILRFLKLCAKQLELLVAISALIFTVWATHNANLQFRDNAIYADSTFNLQLQKSDSLFNAQMNYEKALNDSLVKVIRDLQTINDRQLSVLKNTQKENIDSDRPYFNFDSDRTITDTLLNGNIVFELRETMRNDGNRWAINTKSRSFIFYDNFQKVSIGECEGTDDIAPDEESIGMSDIEIPEKYINDFYLIVEVVYMDEKLNKWFKQYHFAHYHRPSQYLRPSFFNANFEADKLLHHMSIELKKSKDEFYRLEDGTYIPQIQ